MPSSSLSSVTSVTFKATSGVPPNVITHGTQTIDLAGLNLGPNSVEITHQGIKSALSSGSTISHSLQIEHGGFSVVETAGAPYPPPEPTFTQNGLTVTDSFTIQHSSEIRVGEYFRPNYPISNSSGVISYSSSNSLVATVDASSGLIGALSAGSTTITMTQAAATSGNYASRSVSAILVVLPPLIEPSLSNFTVAAKNMGDAAFSLTAPTSNSNGSFSYTSSNTAVATIASGINWTSRNVDASGWQSVAYGNGLWVAVASSGNERVMTSPDGINWTSRKAADNIWMSVAYGNGLWVAVAGNGANSVMTSPDGINWTGRNAPSFSWNSVAYGNGLWVAVAADGANRVMTSPDGINWTGRNAAADLIWNSVAYGNGLWVAVGYNGILNNVMTSLDGITWTSRNAAADLIWMSVAYGNGLWVAVAANGANSVMTSHNGIDWTSRNAPSFSWNSVAYGNGLWVAVSSDASGKFITSANGTDWTVRSFSSAVWLSVAYGNGLWVAVANGFTSNRVITSSADSINIIGAGSSIITATQAATNIYSSKTISATFTVNPPPIANILSNLYTTVETTLNFAISVGYSPFREAIALAFDDNNYTKYLNFNGAGSDVLIDATQNYLVTGLGLTTANDGPERDPTSFILYGSNTPFVITNSVNPNDFWGGGSNFASGGLPGQTLIASGSLNPPLERVTAYPNVTFSNNATRYRYYRLVFDSIRNLPYTANCLQISEIRLSGYL